MRYFKFLIVLLGLVVPALAHADASDIPASATWYFHADIDAMRDGKASRGVYDWLNAEVFEEIREETGIDLDKEADRMTAFAAAGEGPVIVFDGSISTETQDKIVALAAAASEGDLQALKSSGKAYYFFKSSNSSADHESDDDSEDDSEQDHDDDFDIDMGSLDEEAYISVAVRNKVLVTNTEEQMQALLKSNGKIDSTKTEKGALFVLRAERSLIQAGVNAAEMEANNDWDSNILRNTKQVAVLLADLGEKLGFEAQLMTNEAAMANSIASIVRGLISLQAFNDDLDPEVSAVLQTARVDVADNVLKLSLALDPAIIVSALED